MPPSAHPLARLRDPATVRARCAAVLRAVEAGVSPHFRLDRSRLDAVAERVAALTLRRFPDLHIPYHSRWRHFEAGGIDRKAELDALLAGRDPAEQARARFDLTVVSVLLDAGAGPQWRYQEGTALDRGALPPQQQTADDLLALLDKAAAGTATAGPGTATTTAETAETAATPTAEKSPAAGTAADTGYARSEGLGVASLRAFMAGAFSATPGDPLRADAAALRLVDTAALRAVFQVTPNNPMVGLEGRAALISRLGAALQGEAQQWGLQARPGLLYDRITAGGTLHEVSASAVLGEVLRALAPIWTTGSRVQGLAGGDVWRHTWAGSATGRGNDPTTDGWVPFHKLSQWLSYSLLEPLQWAGVTVTGLDELTGLPEYRNGGLLLDSGVIKLRSPAAAARTWKPGDELIIEWRALTVALLDELAVRVRERLGRTAEQLPLACILEGGTWAAGREIAAELRPGGAPPLKLDSDGTVF